MTDQIVLVESPISDGYAEQIFLAANALAPGKKVGTFIATHHHLDHVGGLRYAASQGATIVASSMALPYYEKTFSNPSLIAPDRLATSGQKAAFVGVDDFKVISDDNQRIEIHQVRDSLHSKGKICILIEADLLQISYFTNPAPTTAARPALPVGSELNLIENLIAVGTVIADRPPHRSVRAQCSPFDAVAAFPVDGEVGVRFLYVDGSGSPSRASCAASPSSVSSSQASPVFVENRISGPIVTIRPSCLAAHF